MLMALRRYNIIAKADSSVQDGASTNADGPSINDLLLPNYPNLSVDTRFFLPIIGTSNATKPVSRVID